ncbi:MAG: ABC transporter substrate-binding protein, partial [Bdellovibrionota bacterium]
MFKVLLALAFIPAAAFAEADTVGFGHQNGWAYTPLYVMREKKLVEKHAEAIGIKLTPVYKNLGNAGTIRDALLAKDIQFGVVGPPTLITMYDKTHDIKLVANFVSLPMLLITSNREVKSVCDFLKFSGKIGLPTVKSSVQAVTLQMAAKKSCGSFSALDRLTVGLTHPDSMTALMSGNGEISAHFSSPPFQELELASPAGPRHTVLNSYDVLGGKTTFIAMVGSEKWRAENPKAFQAVSEAVEEAIAFTAKHHREAAAIYLKAEKSKETLDEVAKQMGSSDVSFDSTPNHVETYSDFMHEI